MWDSDENGRRVLICDFAERSLSLRSRGITVRTM